MAKNEQTTIEVDKKRLTEHIIKNCPSLFYNYVHGRSCVKKVEKTTCDLHVFADDLHCPADCPRLSSKEYACDGARCPRTKAIIKELQQPYK